MIRTDNVEQPVRWGMVGGGRGSQIGYSHRDAARRDRNFKLLAGAFDLNAERGREFGVEELGLDADRCYADYQEMFAKEAERTDGIQAFLLQHRTVHTLLFQKQRWSTIFTSSVKSH